MLNFDPRRKLKTRTNNCPKYLKAEGALSSKPEGTPIGDEDVESPSAAKNISRSRRQASNNPRESGSRGDDRGGGTGVGFGGYGTVEAGVDEGAPLLREEVT